MSSEIRDLTIDDLSQEFGQNRVAKLLVDHFGFDETAKVFEERPGPLRGLALLNVLGIRQSDAVAQTEPDDYDPSRDGSYDYR